MFVRVCEMVSCEQISDGLSDRIMSERCRTIIVSISVSSQGPFHQTVLLFTWSLIERSCVLCNCIALQANELLIDTFNSLLLLSLSLALASKLPIGILLE